MIFFEGQQAEEIGETTQNLLLGFVRAALNTNSAMTGAQGIAPLQNAGTENETGGIFVTVSLKDAKAAFASGDNEPFVLIVESSHEQSATEVIEILNGQRNVFDGTRHEWTFEVQLSARNDAAARQGPGNVAGLDRKLRDALTAAIDDGYGDLNALGLYQSEIKGLPPTAGKLNPRQIFVVSYTKNAVQP